MSLLELHNVSYKYEGSAKTVFNDVSLEFETGKIYVIVGKSGAGKSTLLSLLSGLDAATGGSVKFNGENLADMNRDRYRAQKAGVIFQSLNLLPNATAAENIVLSMSVSGIKASGKKERALELLGRMGIPQDKAGRKVSSLSGGERQRVGIARALAHDPALIVADEPTGSLDKETEANILSIFEELAHGEGKCVIIVTHSKKVAAVADEIWGLEKGSFRRLAVIKKKGQ